MRAGSGAEPRLNFLLAGVAAAAVGVPALVVRNAPPVRVLPREAAMPRRVVPSVELPPVEPTRYVEIAPEDAREINAAVPFSDAPNPAARPFRFPGSSDDLTRATDCLASAVYYEAGDDAVGERAVAQVVLNRLRHPAFPKTVCGVVFQGQERSTGCQFTFTCDGALTRYRPSEAAWRRAREVAAAALKGSVYKPVGLATHYHTDWVVPYWSSSLDKIAAVGTHLFFRWTGWWGTPPAFNRRPDGPEPAVGKLALLSEAHQAAAATALADGAFIGEPPVAPAADAATAGGDGTVAAVDAGSLPPRLGEGGYLDDDIAPDADSFLVALPASVPPDAWPALAAKTCGDRLYCKVLGWTDLAKKPKRLPLNVQQIAGMSFSYLRDRPSGVERRLWNCRENKRPSPAQCMRVQVYDPARSSPGPAAFASPPRGPEPLTGIRRREAGGTDRPVPNASALPVRTP